MGIFLPKKVNVTILEKKIFFLDFKNDLVVKKKDFLGSPKHKL